MNKLAQEQGLGKDSKERKPWPCTWNRNMKNVWVRMGAGGYRVGMRVGVCEVMGSRVGRGTHESNVLVRNKHPRETTRGRKSQRFNPHALGSGSESQNSMDKDMIKKYC